MAAHLHPSAEDLRAIHAAHDALLSGGTATAVRDVVVKSWLRSAAAGVDADHAEAPLAIGADTLAQYREAHPLSAVFPLLYDVLGRAAEACESVMAVADQHGQLLWVCGQPHVIRSAGRINFVEGASWSESVAGTNAPGTAIRLDAPVQIRGPEHFTRAVQPWSCVAAPIHDPDTQMILGVVDITGGAEIETPQTVAMVRAAARMAEAEIGRLNAVARLRVPRQARHADGRVIVVEALGRPDCQLDDGSKIIRLSRRHSDILAILCEYPDGLSTEQLAIQLYEDDAAMSTIRAEMTRFRGLFGTATLDSRPYRLRVPVQCDWLDVRDHLAAGRINDAVRCYRGPLLPNSEAPGIVARREELARQLRAAVLSSQAVDLMISWTRARWGADDLEMWQQQHRLTPQRSPLRSVAAAEIARINRDLGV